MQYRHYPPDWFVVFAMTASYPARPAAASAKSMRLFSGDGSPILVQLGAAPGAVPSASAAWHAFARPVAFAEYGAVPSVVFACRCSFFWRPADVLFLVAAGASDAPGFVWRLASAVAVDIFFRLQRCRSLAA